MTNMLTALQVAQKLREEQESQLRWAQQHFETLEDGHFTAIAISKEECVLAPYPDFSANIYRGQTQHYEPCLSSLYRGSPSAIEIFIERIRVAEFELLLSDHPVIVDFSSQSVMGHRYRVDYEALAQHYGLRTELFDFTSNPFVAAFFACCEYHIDQQEYRPILQPRPPGIIYSLNAALDVATKPEAPHSFAVGLQPLRRPAEQYAWCYRLRSPNSLNSQSFVSSHKFAHNPQVSKIILEKFEGGAKLFPYDPVSEKAREIAVANRFSEAAFALAMERYGQNMEEQSTLKKIAQEGIQIVGDREIIFSQSELESMRDEWNSRRREFMSRIHCRLVYGPMPFS